MQPLVFAPVRITVSTRWSVSSDGTPVPKKIDGAFLQTYVSPSCHSRPSTSASHVPLIQSSMAAIFHGGRSDRSALYDVVQKTTGAPAARARGSRRAVLSTAACTSGLRPIGACGFVTAFWKSTTSTAGEWP
jgi:hypothetical protein